MRREKKDHFYQIPENNIIPELLTDEQYKTLNHFCILHNVKLRDYTIGRDYKAMTSSKIVRVNILQEQYPKLSRSTVRKIAKRFLKPKPQFFN